MTESSSSLSQQLDYKKVDFVHPTYTMHKILPQSGSQNVTVTTAGGQETILEIPINAVNLAESFLSFTMNPDATANAGIYNWTFADVITPIRQIQLYTRSGIYLADVNEVGVYSKICNKAETKMNEYLEYDKFYNNTGTCRFLEASDQLAVENGTGNTYSRSYENTARDVNYIEPKYAFSGTGAANADPVVIVRIPLNSIKNSIFSLNKDLYFGEIVILRIVWQATNRVYFTSTLATDPTSGGAVAYAANNNITNLSLFLAIEQNQDIVNSLRSQVLAGGLNILIPYVYTYKFNLNGNSQTVSLRFNRGHGRKLKKIFHSVFNNVENKNSAYDCRNIVGFTKTNVFYTMLDNKRLQEYDVTRNNFDDYMLLKDKLKGSVISSSGVYYYNWFWLEDWSGLSDSSISPKDIDTLETGLTLDIERKWDFYGSDMQGGANYNHYSFAITQKMLTVGPQGITVI